MNPHSAEVNYTSQKTERSLVVLKPDAVLRRQIGVNVLKALKKLPGASILAFKEFDLPEELAKQLYAEHEGKIFYPSLIEMMTSPIGVIAIAMEGPGIVSSIRDLLGPTFVERAKTVKGCLRGKYGIVKGVNVAYASDSTADGSRNIDLFVTESKLVIDKAPAAKALDSYIAKWDGKFPDNTKSMQKEAFDVLEALDDVKAVLQTENRDASEEDVRSLLKIILDSLLN
nr:nucleoside-diphosphate kinase [Candidatus Sigynarchaeota archaeon]